MIFADLELSRRLERTEALGCMQCAEARRRISPESGAECMQCAGTYAVFDGVASPITQTFGLGLFEELTESALDQIEQFFLTRGASVQHEVSPFAGLPVLQMLSKRGYVPAELSNVMYRPIEEPSTAASCNIQVRLVSAEDADLWSEISTRGWTDEHPELRDFILELGKIIAARERGLCFLAEFDGVSGGAGMLVIHEGIALFGGASTVPELRHRGIQGALLHARMRYAFDQGCDLAMMVAHPGTESQRNAERKGFRIAYTRTKWELKK